MSHVGNAELMLEWGKPCSICGHFFASLFVLLAATQVATSEEQDLHRRWVMQIKTGGGNLEVELEVWKEQSAVRAKLINGPEQIDVAASEGEGQLQLSMPHYDSWVELQEDNGSWQGKWRKRRTAEEHAEVDVALVPKQKLERESPKDYLGRWSVQFADSEDEAVAVFEAFGENEMIGTFLTTTGDYRYLHGYVLNNEMRLSCFDGAHAFLFTAKKHAGGELSGEFFSGNWYQDTWTARRDPDASLPDAFLQTKLTQADGLSQLAFPDLSGKIQRLDSPKLLGKVTLVEIFGTWCPNCHDEAAYLKELEQKYGARGLQVLGLAFELTGDFARDAKQVARYKQRFDITYPILIAGISDKAKATQKLPVLDQVRSYPTTLFLDQRGGIRAIYTGFSGPATGEAHQKLRNRFETLIERMLSE